MHTRLIVKVDPATGEVLASRRSPKRGAWHDAFTEATSIARLLPTAGFAYEVVLTDERETRCATGRGSWRRKGVETVERQLLGVHARHRVAAPADLWALLPGELPTRFTVQDLADLLKTTPHRARAVAYSLRHAGAARYVGRRARHHLYERV